MNFVLQETRLVCNTVQKDPLIQVQLNDAAGQPVAGIEVIVKWDQGEDHFFTGLQPEIGLGYGDFLMTPNVVYSIQISGNAQLVNDLQAAECISEDESRYWGSWLLIFSQP